jgi:hypothetical protein
VTLLHSIESRIRVFRKEQQLVPSSRIVATGVKSIVTDGVIEVGRILKIDKRLLAAAR